MSFEQGFADLRLNRQAGQTDEGFWPSFTDIMTVIVMIFLLAMVILLVRNMELVERLRSAVLAEREAAELARATGAERETLRHRLTGAERQLAQLRAEVVRLEALKARQEATIADQVRQLETLADRRDRLDETLRQRSGELATTRRELDDLQARHAKLQALHAQGSAALEELRRRHRQQDGALADARRRLAALEQRHTDLQARQAETAAALAGLEDRYRSRGDELVQTRQALSDLEQRHTELQTRYKETVTALQTRHRETVTALEAARVRDDARGAELSAARRDLDEIRARHAASLAELETLRRKLAIGEQALTQALARLKAADLELSGLKQDYGDLKLKYDDLVKPARSAEGRYLVEVRYFREEGRPRLSYREPGDSEFRDVGREQLETRLQALAAAHPEGLYVKVIFPEDSGLGYEEAWRFTSQLHRRYDYYYRAERERDRE